MCNYELNAFSCQKDDVIIVRYDWNNKGTIEDLRDFVDKVGETFPDNRVLVMPNDMVIQSLNEEEYQKFADDLPRHFEALRKK